MSFMTITDFVFSRHAIDRMLDMEVDPAEVRKCLEFPTLVVESDRGDNRSLYYGKRITCVVTNGTNEVVTVVWRTQEQWARDILDKGEYGGRTYRG